MSYDMSLHVAVQKPEKHGLKTANDVIVYAVWNEHVHIVHEGVAHKWFLING